jgi:hypothetical protein
MEWLFLRTNAGEPVAYLGKDEKPIGDEIRS